MSDCSSSCFTRDGAITPTVAIPQLQRPVLDISARLPWRLILTALVLGLGAVALGYAKR